MPKVAKRCQKVPKDAKRSQKIPKDAKIPYENVEQHYRKWYADVMDQFVAS